MLIILFTGFDRDQISLIIEEKKINITRKSLRLHIHQKYTYIGQTVSLAKKKKKKKNCQKV